MSDKRQWPAAVSYTVLRRGDCDECDANYRAMELEGARDVVPPWRCKHASRGDHTITLVPDPRGQIVLKPAGRGACAPENLLSAWQAWKSTSGAAHYPKSRCDCPTCVLLKALSTAELEDERRVRADEQRRCELSAESIFVLSDAPTDELTLSRALKAIRDGAGTRPHCRRCGAKLHTFFVCAICDCKPLEKIDPTEPRAVWVVEAGPYIHRDTDERWRSVGVADSGAAAVGVAWRFMEVFGGQWKFDAYRGIWEQVDLGDDWDDREAVRVQRLRANRCDWESFPGERGFVFRRAR